MIDELELKLTQILYPPDFFQGWTDRQFIDWLHLDEYGNKMEHPRENDVLAVLNTVEPFGELGFFYDICLQELIKLKQQNLINNESNNNKR